MAHLVAEGPEPQQRWSRELADQTPVRLGRAPQQGWEVNWDRQISREHADLLLDNGRLTVQQLDGAQNPIHYNGESVSACTVSQGEQFRIGRTTFRLVADAAKAATDDEASRTIGDYVVDRLLGAGGMGSVYLATHQPSGRNVALKVLGPEQSANPDMVSRFRSEAKAASRLSHSNIVGVYEAATIDGVSFIAQEFVDGIDIAKAVAQRGALSIKRGLDVIRQVSRALQHAHEQGIVHRDIKPSNLLVTREGIVKIADLGVARSLEEAEDAGVTAIGTMVGTVDYIAPEQADDSHAADARSDIYSLGCTWYEMLTGQLPFPEGGLTEKVHAHATRPAPDPREFNPKVPEGIVVVLARMMAKSPDERYQSADDLLVDIETDTLIQTDVSDSVLAALADSHDSVKLEDAPSGPLTVTCGDCGKSYRVRRQLAGKRLKCRDCGKVIQAPAQ